jgi:hypothetical protein
MIDDPFMITTQTSWTDLIHLSDLLKISYRLIHLLSPDPSPQVTIPQQYIESVTNRGLLYYRKDQLLVVLPLCGKFLSRLTGRRLAITQLTSILDLIRTNLTGSPSRFIER